jgi:hypothetical protein
MLEIRDERLTDHHLLDEQDETRRKDRRQLLSKSDTSVEVAHPEQLVLRVEKRQGAVSTWSNGIVTDARTQMTLLTLCSIVRSHCPKSSANMWKKLAKIDADCALEDEQREQCEEVSDGDGRPSGRDAAKSDGTGLYVQAHDKQEGHEQAEFEPVLAILSAG